MANIKVVSVKGGEKLEAELRKIAKIKATMSAGFFEDAKYPDGTNVAYVAYLNEYGGHNPPRPFLKRTGKAKFRKWVNGIKHQLKANGISQESVRRAYDLAGMVAVGDIKRTIADWPSDDPYPNAKSTIAAKARRGRDGENAKAIDPERVLIDSGQMVASVSHEVKTK